LHFFRQQDEDHKATDNLFK